jgi:TonB family protein
VVLLLTLASASAADKREQGTALLSHASQLTNLEREGDTPFLLRVNWTALTLASGPAQGKYSLLWVNADQWREEISLSNFTQVRVGSKDRVWTKRNLNVRPFVIGQIAGLVESLWKLAPSEDEAIEKVSRRSEHGVESNCVELQTKSRAKRTLCFAVSGEIADVTRYSSEPAYAYFDFFAFGARSFPRRLRITEHSSPVIVAEVEDLAPASSPNAGLFSPPAGATEAPTCAHPTGGKLVTKVPPTYPMSARQQHQQGSVTTFAIIQTDGSVQAEVIRTAGKDLDEAALTAVRQWKYSPTICGSTPIPLETEITVNFTLQ